MKAFSRLHAERIQQLYNTINQALVDVHEGSCATRIAVAVRVHQSTQQLHPLSDRRSEVFLGDVFVAQQAQLPERGVHTSMNCAQLRASVGRTIHPNKPAIDGDTIEKLWITACNSGANRCAVAKPRP
ncbi:MAG: hypothetical protein MUF54_00170 [Polyangiaceae bacterium]|nr:hypothetical protein [Polyangiaceae bacterium]